MYRRGNLLLKEINELNSSIIVSIGLSAYSTINTEGFSCNLPCNKANTLVELTEATDTTENPCTCASSLILDNTVLNIFLLTSIEFNTPCILLEISLKIQLPFDQKDLTKIILFPRLSNHL